MIVAPVVAFVVIILYLLQPEHGGRGWIFPLSRNLSFIEEVLNFVLWTVLIRNRSRDVVLLLVSAGLGIQVTGRSDRPDHQPLRALAFRLLASGRHHSSLRSGRFFIWYRAFRAYGRHASAPKRSRARRFEGLVRPARAASPPVLSATLVHCQIVVE